MEALGDYVLRVVAAAMVCMLVKNLIPEKNALGGIAELLCGLFMMLTMLSPWKQIRLEEFPLSLTESFTDAEVFRKEGEKAASDALADIIKQRTETYILDKAGEWNATLRVEVTLSEDALPVPVGARLTGIVSPYVRSRLERTLEEELGIRKENQVWIGGT